MPYVRTTNTYDLSNGTSTTVVDSLTLDSLANAATTVPVSSAAPLMSGNGQYADASVIYNLSNGLYQVVGHHYFFYASAGQIYRMDLTASQPQPTQMATLKLTQLCSLTSHESELTGQSGVVLVTGLTTSGATSADCSGPNVQAWAIPFNATTSTAISPLGFVPNVVAVYRNGSTITGYLTQVGGSLYVTSDLGQRGTLVSGLSLGAGSQVYDVGVGGNSTLDYVVTPGATSGMAIYSVTSSGVAQQITGLPTNASFPRITADSNGNIYIPVAIPTTTSNSTTYAVQIYKVTSGQSVANLQATISIGSNYLNDFQVNAAGTGGLLFTNSTSSPSTSAVYLANFQAQTATAVNAVNAVNAQSVSFVGLGEDGNAILIGFTPATSNTASSNTIWSVNPLTGAIAHTLANQQFDGGLGYAYPADYGSQFIIGSLLTQASNSVNSSTCSPISEAQVFETQNYSVTGQFAPPTNSCGVSTQPGLYQTSGQSYVLGTAFGSNSSGSLFSVNPQATAGANATVLGSNTTTTTGTSTTSISWQVPF
jgi:hypothetical protein